MEKFIVTPISKSENEGGRTFMEKNSPVETTEHIEIISEKLINGKNSSTHLVDNKSIKIKKLKIRKSKGEKRKFPDKSESVKKIKRKRKEEKSTESNLTLSENSFNKEIKEIEIVHVKEVLSDSQHCRKIPKIKDSTRTDNDSDVENGERVIRQMSSRKSKAIASSCKDTLDVLLKFDLGVLNLLNKSLDIIKSHSLLNNKYVSTDTLIDLVALALEKNTASEDIDSEKELSFIITKCTNELCTTPKRCKAQQSMTILPFSPKNISAVLEGVPTKCQTPNKDMNKLNSKSQDSEEVTENSEGNAVMKLPEKIQESTVEKSGNNFCITNYFKKLKKTIEERDKNERFSCFTTKTDMFLAPKLGGELTGEKREKFEETFAAQNCESCYLIEHFRKPRRSKKSRASICQENKSTSCTENVEKTSCPVGEKFLEKCSANRMESSEIAKPDSTTHKRVTLIRVNQPKIEPTEAACRTRAKLFQFHDNRRPPYWGTWRRKSEAVRPRRPFGKDKMFNYEIDSDDEWEEEEEPGESLHGSDDEKEPEEDYEVDNDFFVPHGYLSDDENPEKENLSPKTKLDLLKEQFTSEQKQKTRKMTPIVFGTFWMYKGLTFEGNLYQDLQIEKLQYVPWTSTPVEIEEEPTNTVGSKHTPKQKIFPNEEIPNLIKMIHGSPQNCDHLAKKFLLYWETEKIPVGNRPGLTKVCVQKKIKELAAWQASHEKGKMCWQVPKETREEFGAEVEEKTLEKKPRKCFIWKFVRKAEKSLAAGNPPPASPLEPEVVIFES